MLTPISEQIKNKDNGWLMGGDKFSAGTTRDMVGLGNTESSGE